MPSRDRIAVIGQIRILAVLDHVAADVFLRHRVDLRPVYIGLVSPELLKRHAYHARRSFLGAICAEMIRRLVGLSVK
jgi:hypothetical protein